MALTLETINETSVAALEIILAKAESAFGTWAGTTLIARSEALELIADRLDEASDELIQLAMAETHLAEPRLMGELKRTMFQLRFFAKQVLGGEFLNVRIDHKDDEWPMGAPRPDLRRTMQPLGPVLVFAASNFPFAFSVAGGDTASALAAGCPVVLKGHPGHPALSRKTADVVLTALADAGAPEGTFDIIFGTRNGAEALADCRIKAGAFTGGIPGGRTLFDIASGRAEPIPFYGELGSNNPVFVTPAAEAERGESIAREFVTSFTQSAGQLCTKPGTLFVPSESAILDELRNMELPSEAPLLNEGILAAFSDGKGRLESHDGVRVLNDSTSRTTGDASPILFHSTLGQIRRAPESLLAECFGPAALVVTYENVAELSEVAKLYEGQLTASIHGTNSCDVGSLMHVLSQKAGRVLWNQWPTGVSVTYAQQHGGPYPASTAVQSTSVGTAAMDRFLRPLAFQGFPDHLLPAPVRDSNPLGIPRQVNGECV
ncbi:aldehyde dehydrogenase (NADP(+)) [Paeniglutamicibacter sp. ABSL32-1]|uniref:aldehyde dehydrogenase (NADP(+)) n=1 Tax=Paeniglutamicibacter quisquiliarum TaxID=2849498 RepID=UPI001C2D221D|nr:aldehyde dehydrogenase (NADP(+)) [Paeniglutamicibacter quisquiliarum]MBV1777763.1 aldehyde dehydrogenase (NADP(+)) [Paeniglutamicibacter quisquiliarum]